MAKMHSHLYNLQLIENIISNGKIKDEILLPRDRTRNFELLTQRIMYKNETFTYMKWSAGDHVEEYMDDANGKMIYSNAFHKFFSS